MRQKTETMLCVAFMELLKKCPFSKITIQKLAGQCGVNRQTFYYHFDNIYELDDDTAAHVFKVAAKISKAYKKALDFDGLNIVQNNGEVAGQTVFHFHMHIIPRIKGDTVNVGWVPGTADNDTIASIVEKVTPYL